jgi:hypothetical protein
LGGFTESNHGYLRVSATLIPKVANTNDAAAAWYNSNWGSVTFGNNESLFAVQRILYARGYNSNGSSTTHDNSLGAGAYYSSATAVDAEYCWHIGFFANSIYMFDHWYTYHARNIRLFRDN